MMREVILHGRLAGLFGANHRFCISTPAMAVLALSANHPEFITEIRQGAYQVAIENRSRAEYLCEAALSMRLSAPCAIHIIPLAQGASGSSKGIITAVLGVALVASAVAFAPAAGMGASIFAQGSLGATLLGGTTFGQMAMLGGMLALGGVSQLLTSTPSVSDYDEDDVSFLFDGSVNRTSQGGAKPVVYGKMRVGSITVSAGIETVSLPYDGDGGSGSSYKITASSNCPECGSISPEGTVSVAAGGSQKFYIQAYEGYSISDVVVDDESVGIVSEYEFSDVSSDHAIGAYFS